jgi:hypothetical protein
VDCPYEFLAGMCRGAEPLECAPKFQIQNPKRVQGLVPAGVWGVPRSFSLPPIMGTVLKGSERVVAGGHGPPYGYCWIPASAGMTRRRCLPKASLKPASTRVPKRACRGALPLCRWSGGYPPILQFEKVQDVSCRGLGCPQIPLFSPQDRRSASGGMGARGLKEGCETAFWGGYWRSFDTSPRLWP